MKILNLILYYIIFSNLPNSWWPGGDFYNYLRYKTLKRIIKLGVNNKIQKGVYIGNGNNVEIGDNCQINEKARLDNVIIANNVMIARDCIFLGKMHGFKEINVPMMHQGVINSESTIIEDDVWIGARVIVMPGIKIAKGCIIGAGAVVTKNTEEYGVYAGVPARLIKKRN
jgi:maltose O-acetyltransferase